ncbi:MAG: peptide-methionine (S)-S-oxide reductase MsrA [Steroidobacteraceae bacterium]|jgi:peptide-methionine (S)-S-oxide reductase|nr:peptide-methionine (S)-S-oxide reductase MsrA [Steroidobacteraceae bacterium]
MHAFPRFLAAILLVTSMVAAVPAQQPGDARPAASGAAKRAVFAAGCFWCVEAAYEGTPGVLDVMSGFAGGTLANPSYEQVTAGGTGHYEVVQVTYDPARVSYARLLDIYWRNVDPFDGSGQFCDRGDSYRPAIFAGDAAERQQAEASKAALEKRLGKPFAVRVLAAVPFYPAEDYHQDYHVKNPLRYKFYSTSCGRAARLEQVWGKPAPAR